MSTTTGELMRQLTESGVALALTDAGALRLRGRRPADALVAHARTHRDALIELLRQRERVQTLGERLNTGWELIDAEAETQRFLALEEHWIRLLHQYERTCRALEQAEEASLPDLNGNAQAPTTTQEVRL